MTTVPGQVEIFYLDDMEDEIMITEMKLKRQNLDLNVRFFLVDTDMLSVLAERIDSGSVLPDIIVTDLNMPGMGGLRLISKLRSDGHYEDITIGACTGSDNPADETNALAAGADFVTIKPFDRASLAHICEKTGRFQLDRHENGKDHLHFMPSSPSGVMMDAG